MTKLTEKQAIIAKYLKNVKTKENFYDWLYSCSNKNKWVFELTPSCEAVEYLEKIARRNGIRIY